MGGWQGAAGNYDVVYGTQGKADGRLARRCAFKKTNKLVQ